ncbi:MAG: hypothetical protein BWY82_00744 [Verrucomicrobia bacterium ADurb.Bin474]|nr:MAG: hypothetical protein BWY82_00744 [Verrucomicrobia bacterium ADurb.Bin474]
MLAVFVQRGGADAVQFATSQHRFEHVTRIHRTFRFSSSDNRVQFIHKQYDAAFRCLHFLKNRLEALFKFAPVLCPGKQRTHIQTENRLVLEPFRNISLHDSLR